MLAAAGAGCWGQLRAAVGGSKQLLGEGAAVERRDGQLLSDHGMTDVGKVQAAKAKTEKQPKYKKKYIQNTNEQTKQNTQNCCSVFTIRGVISKAS